LLAEGADYAGGIGGILEKTDGGYAGGSDGEAGGGVFEGDSAYG
jgi:hypothetical protein